MGPDYMWMGGFMWLFPMIILVFLIIIGVLMYSRSSRHYPPESRTPRNAEDSALEILKKRYAKGEISKEEYEQIKKDIL